MIKFALKQLSLIFGSQLGDGSVFHSSKTCPECGSKLCKSGGWGERPCEPQSKTTDGSPGVSPHQEDWFCPNPDCPAKGRHGLALWCSPEAMDIPGGDELLVAQLVKSGLVRDVAELYQLKVAEVANLGKKDEKSAKNFVDAIVASKARDAGRVLYGLGISHISVGVAQSLALHFPTLDHVLDASLDQLTEAEGSSEVIANSVVQWWGDPVNRRLIGRLRKAGLNFKSELYNPTLTDGPSVGETFVR